MRKIVIPIVLAAFAGLTVIPSASAEPPAPGQLPEVTASANTTLEEAKANITRRVSDGELAKVTPKLLAESRPYAGERVGIEKQPNPGGPTIFCTMGYAGVSSTGGQYLLTAGHCGRETSSVTGRFFYPVCTAQFNCPIPASSLIGDTGSRWAFDATVGDFAAVRANSYTSAGKTLVRKFRQPENGRIDTMNSAGNPALGQNVAVYAGNSEKVIKGFIGWTNQCADYAATPEFPAVHSCNQAIIQSDLATEGCAIGGDSGSGVAAGLFAVGIVSASGSDSSGHCFTWITQLANAMNSWGLHSAPASG